MAGSKMFSRIIGIDASRFFHKIGVSVAPHPAPTKPGQHMSKALFVEHAATMIALQGGAKAYAPLARNLDVTLTRLSLDHASQVDRLRKADPPMRDLILHVAHQLAFSSYIAAEEDPTMYRLYARAHELLAFGDPDAARTQEHLYRAVWGCAQYAERVPDDDGAWQALSEQLQVALQDAPKEHKRGLTELSLVADGQISETWLGMDSAAEVLGAKVGIPLTREHVADALKTFLAGKDQQFKPDQYVTFAPFERLTHISFDKPGEKQHDGDVFLTSFSLWDDAESLHRYRMTVRVIHAGGVDSEKGKPVSVTRVEFRDASLSDFRFFLGGVKSS